MRAQRARGPGVLWWGLAVKEPEKQTSALEEGPVAKVDSFYISHKLAFHNIIYDLRVVKHSCEINFKGKYWVEDYVLFGVIKTAVLFRNNREKRKEGDSIFYSKSKKARRGGIFPTPASCFKRKKKRHVNKLILKLPPNVTFDQGNKHTLLSIKRHHKANNKKQRLPYSIWFQPRVLLFGDRHFQLF